MAGCPLGMLVVMRVGAAGVGVWVLVSTGLSPRGVLIQRDSGDALTRARARFIVTQLRRGLVYACEARAWPSGVHGVVTWIGLRSGHVWAPPVTAAKARDNNEWRVRGVLTTADKGRSPPAAMAMQ